jgi:phage terminase large subunit-like protein
VNAALLLDAAEAAQTLSERRLRDPLYRFVMCGDPIAPYGKQWEFLRSKKAHVYFLAANRSGKSRILAAQMASFARFGCLNPEDIYTGRVAPDFTPKRIWIVGVSMQRLLETFVPMLFGGPYQGAEEPYIPEEEVVDFNMKRAIVRLAHGTMISLLSHEAGRDKFQAASIHALGLDEAPPVGIFNEAVMRQGGGTVPLYVRMAATLLPPVGAKYSTSWVYDRIVKKWQSGETRDRVDIFNASIYENPGMPREIVAQYESIYPPGSPDRQVRIEGKLIAQAFGASAYGNFHRNLHVNAKLGRKSVVRNIPLLFAFDVNVRPMTAVVAQEVGSEIRVLDEIFLNFEGRAATLVDLARMFRERFPTHGAALRLYGDAASRHRSAQSGKTDLLVLQNELVGYPAPVEVYVPESNAFVHDRLATVNYALQGARGEVGLQIAAHCKELIADCEEVQSDGAGGILKSRDKSDPYYLRTHISDALGYLLYQIRPIILDDRTTKRGVVMGSPGPVYSFGRADRVAQPAAIGDWNGERMVIGGSSWR